MIGFRLLKILNLVSYNTRNHFVKNEQLFFIQRKVFLGDIQHYSTNKDSRNIKSSRGRENNSDSFNAQHSTKKKLSAVPKVSIVDLEGNTLVLDINEAKKLAKKQNTELVKLESAEDKLKFKFVKVADLLFKESDAKSTGNKKTKIVLIHPNIFTNDLQTKMKQIIKILNKGHNVLVNIKKEKDLTNAEKQETIIKTLKSEIGKIHEVSKEVATGSSVRLIFSPNVNRIVNNANKDSDNLSE